MFLIPPHRLSLILTSLVFTVLSWNVAGAKEKVDNEPKLTGNSLVYTSEKPIRIVDYSAKCPLSREPRIDILNVRNFAKGQNSIFPILVEDEDGHILSYKNYSGIPTASGILALECKSAAPVMWKFQGFMTSEILKATSSKRINEDPRHNSTFCYSSTIQIRILEDISNPVSGFYTCSHLNSAKNTQVASIYVYGRGDVKRHVVGHFDNITTIIAKPSGSNGPLKVTLPCRASHPNISVELTKVKDGNHPTIYEPIDKQTLRITYDPKYGFNISTRSIGGIASNSNEDISLSGHYRCRLLSSMSGTKNAEFLFLVEQENLKASSTENENNQLKPTRSSKLQIKLEEYIDDNKEHCQRFVCYHEDQNQHSVNSHLSLSMLSCGNPNECYLLMGFLFQQDTEESVRDQLFEASFSDLDTCADGNDPEVNNLSSYDGGVVICTDKRNLEYQFVEFYKSVDTEDGEVLLYPSSIPLPPSAQGSNYASSSTKIDPSSVITIYMNAVNKYAGEDRAEFDLTCRWSNFPFARGAKWLFGYANGTQESPEVMATTDMHLRNLVSSMNSTVFGRPSEVQSIICLIPLFDSDQWIQKSFPFTHPRITNASEKEQVFFDTDTDKMIFCEVEGSPPPTVAWYTKEVYDKPFGDVTQNIQTHHTYLDDPPRTRCVLHFNKTTFNVTTVYTCNATNFKGEVLHHVNVVIKPYNIWIFWICGIAGLFVFTTVILSVFFYKYWKVRKQLKAKLKNQLQSNRPRRDPSVRELNVASAVPAGSDDTAEYANLSEGFQIALERGYNRDLYEKNEKDLHIGEHILGEGHVGRVVLGSFLENCQVRPVAVKMLARWNREDAKMLLEELLILSYVNEGHHDHIVGLVGAITKYHYGKFQIIMEYCALGSLKQYLKSNQRNFSEGYNSDVFVDQTSGPSYVTVQPGLNKTDLIRWSHQCALGMEYLSSKKIVHGDLAARNLLLTDNRQLKITDFGLSRMLKKYQRVYTPSLNNRTTAMPWTLLALECVGSDLPLSRESDVWAFGIALWEIFSLGEEPYSPLTLEQVFLKLSLGQRLESPIHAPPTIYNIMQNCWKKEPEERPTFSVLASELGNVLLDHHLDGAESNNEHIHHQLQEYIKITFPDSLSIDDFSETMTLSEDDAVTYMGVDESNEWKVKFNTS